MIKTLEQILDEELKSDRHRTMKVGDIAGGVPTPEAVQQSIRFWERIEDRMHQDPAVKRLSELAAISTTTLLTTIPREQFAFAFQRLFIELLSVWEDTNNRFTDQLKPKA